MQNAKSSLGALVVVMLCFFTMGFVDLVGIASNYVQQDLGLTHSQANIMPSLVFFTKYAVYFSPDVCGTFTFAVTLLRYAVA